MGLPYWPFEAGEVAMAEPRCVPREPDITSWAPDACLSYAERFLAKARHHFDRGEVEPAVKRAREAIAELRAFVEPEAFDD